MNVEKLFCIGEAIQKDLQIFNIQAHTNKVASSLQQIVSHPNQPQHQQNLSSQLKSFKDAAEKSAFNQFPPLWKQICAELGFEGLLGVELFEEVENIIRRNGIVPSVALDEIKVIQARINPRVQGLNQMITSFDALDIESEELDQGECELGILVPRNYVNEDISKLAYEFKEIESIVKIFEEIATGSRTEVRLKTISSSDFGVFLDLLPGVAAGVSIAIERIVALYKNSLEIKKLKQELEEKDVPKEPLGPLNVYIGDYMSEGIQKIADEFVDARATKSNTERKNELKTELKLAMNKIANRVDRGFHLEVRYSPVEDDVEEDEEAETTEDENTTFFEELSESVSKQSFIRPSGEPILFLTETIDKKTTKKKVTKTTKKKTTKKKS